MHNRRVAIAALLGGLALGGAVLWNNPTARTELRILLGRESSPRSTPLAVVAPPPRATATSAAPTQSVTAAPSPTHTPRPTQTPLPTATPTPVPTPTPVVVDGRVYDAYIPAAVKEGQFDRYTCEFDAAWVVLASFGINADVAEIIARTPIDTSIEP